MTSPSPKRHPGRTALLLVLVLAILGAGGCYGWRYTQSQLLRRRDRDGHVAVFQGVQGKVIGLQLNHVASTERPDARRSQPGHAEQGQAGHSGAEQGRRRAHPAWRCAIRPTDTSARPARP